MIKVSSTVRVYIKNGTSCDREGVWITVESDGTLSSKMAVLTVGDMSVTILREDLKAALENAGHTGAP